MRLLRSYDVIAATGSDARDLPESYIGGPEVGDSRRQAIVVDAHFYFLREVVLVAAAVAAAAAVVVVIVDFQHGHMAGEFILICSCHN